MHCLGVSSSHLLQVLLLQKCNSRFVEPATSALHLRATRALLARIAVEAACELSARRERLDIQEEWLLREKIKACASLNHAAQVRKLPFNWPHKLDLLDEFLGDSVDDSVDESADKYVDESVPMTTPLAILNFTARTGTLPLVWCAFRELELLDALVAKSAETPVVKFLNEILAEDGGNFLCDLVVKALARRSRFRHRARAFLNDRFTSNTKHGVRFCVTRVFLCSRTCSHIPLAVFVIVYCSLMARRSLH